MSVVPGGICKNCGMIWKVKHYCRAKDNICKSCGKIGHMARMCHSSRQKHDYQDWRRNSGPHDNNSYRNHYRQNFHNQDRTNWRERAKKPKVFSNGNQTEKSDKINHRNSESLNKSDSKGRVMKNKETDDDKRSSLNTNNLKNWRRKSMDAHTNVGQSRCDSGMKDHNHDDYCLKFTGVGDKSKKEQKKYDAVEFGQELAKSYYDRGEYETALSLYSRLIELCPNDPKNFNNRATCYMLLEQYDNAVADAEKVIELDPSCVTGYERIIKCEIVLGHTISAETYLEKLSQIEPKNGLIAIKRKKLDKLQEHLKNKIIAMRSKNYQSALECINKCLRISPHCLSYKMKKAKYLVLLKRREEAQPVLNAILMKDPSNIDAKYLMGVCLYHSDIDEALNYFKEVLQLDPDYSKCLQIHEKTRKIVELKKTGNNEFKLGNFSAAHDIYSSAISIDPNNSSINMRLIFNMGQASYHSANFGRAIKEFSRAINIYPNFLKALKQRGRCYMEMKNYKKAIADFSRVCNLESKSEFQKLIDDAKKLLASVNQEVYTILGVSRNASIKEVKKAYKEKAMLHHPDRHSNATVEHQKEHEIKFKAITMAYRDIMKKYKR